MLYEGQRYMSKNFNEVISVKQMLWIEENSSKKKERKKSKKVNHNIEKKGHMVI